MPNSEIRIRVGLLTAALMLISATSALGHDCSGPGDCQSVPDNVAKTTAVIGGLAVAELGLRLLRGDGEPGLDETESEEEPPRFDLEELYEHEVGAGDEADAGSPSDAEERPTGAEDPDESEGLYGSGRDFDRPLGEPPGDVDPG